MKKFKVLNLYGGIGGNRKLWDTIPDVILEITAVEYDPKIAAIYQDFFPNDTVIVADAHQYLLDHYKEFDFIWASPPCQSHSIMNIATSKPFCRYPKMELYQEIILLQSIYKGIFLVENVIPYYTSLIAPTYQIYRHNFWCNFSIKSFNVPKPEGNFIRDFSNRQMIDYLKLDMCNEKLFRGQGFRQMLRNCVHPEIGLAILQSALGIIKEISVKPGQLF